MITFIEVRLNGLAFLDLIVIQIEVESQYPRLVVEDFCHCLARDNRKGWWYPPATVMYSLLKNDWKARCFIGRGKEYVFVANADNLGAIVDLSILFHSLLTTTLLNSRETQAPLYYSLYSSDRKTPADVKGGTLISYEGKVQVFGHQLFRWVNLKAIKRLVEADALNMEIIPNRKSLIWKASWSRNWFFEKAIGINVPRSRFLPVKATSDLLLVQALYKSFGGFTADVVLAIDRTSGRRVLFLAH
ncbi:hypothetical protein IFM89_004873 [Coptis chinensis]|uniref:UTP--glucose-1-phosphate uridylyltransferase n=1 Tax=Coptis chinensis TaxID=261450 RepID=A0A835LLL9_9MAGN|nr:hypothetical protein IFM89_004873 [Coptis chinensis]